MLKRTLATVVAVLTLSTSLSAAGNQCCDMTCNTNCSSPCDGFYVGADFLYWKTCVSELNYGAVFDPTVSLGNTTTGTFRFVQPDWEPGFRIRAGKQNLWCGWDLHASYTRLEATARSSYTEPQGGEGFDTVYLGDQNLTTDDGNARYFLRYQDYDILLAYGHRIAPCHTLTPFFGVAGLVAEQCLTVTAIDVDSDPDSPQTLFWKSDYNGAGMKMGIGYVYNLCECLDFFARGSFSIVCADLDVRAHYRREDNFIQPPEITDTTYTSKQCVFVPGTHIQMGLRGEMECGCTTIGLQAGWEFVNWQNMGTPQRFSDTSSDAFKGSPGSVASMGFHGLFAGATVSF